MFSTTAPVKPASLVGVESAARRCQRWFSAGFGSSLLLWSSSALALKKKTPPYGRVNKVKHKVLLSGEVTSDSCPESPETIFKWKTRAR